MSWEYPVSEELVDVARRARSGWTWAFYEHWLSLQGESRVEWLEDLGLPIASDGFRLTAVQRAELFQALWCTERFWDRDAGMARQLLLVFHDIEGSADGPEELRVIHYVKRACPYLAELDEDDLDWTGFKLPCERQ